MIRFSVCLVAALVLSFLNRSPASAQQEKEPKVKITDEKPGTGPAAKKGDILVVHYTGWLKSGKQFDSSKGQAPFQFTVGAGEVIKGWDLGMVGMKVGGVRKLVIPSELAYGAKGAGDDIPANAELTFQVELLKIKTAEDFKVKITDEKVGNGPAAKKGDVLVVHYTGWLKNGKKFDSSKDRQEPFNFTLGVGDVIKGWDAGMVGMKVGGMRKLVIPSDLGYGARGSGKVIPPDAELTFQVELLEIRKSAQ